MTEQEKLELTSKVDTLTIKVDELAQSNKRTEAWLATNHDTLSALADGMRSFEKLGNMAEKVSKIIKPIFWLVTIAGAFWAWGGKILASAVAHVRI